MPAGSQIRMRCDEYCCSQCSWFTVLDSARTCSYMSGFGLSACAGGSLPCALLPGSKRANHSCIVLLVEIWSALLLAVRRDRLHDRNHVSVALPRKDRLYAVMAMLSACAGDHG